MPPASEILAGLGRISNEAFALAVAWHLLLGGYLLALRLRWSPAPRLSGGLLVAPLLSVSALAWAQGNPFNGAVFALLAGALALLAWRAAPGAPLAPTPAEKGLGALLVAFAWVYPHFLAGRSPLAYLIGAPLGLVPCPTLSLLAGLTLLGFAPRERAWRVTVAGAAALYGLIGVARLHVWIDLLLVAGAAGVALQALREPAPAAQDESVGPAARS